MITESRIIYFRHIFNSDGTISGESFFRIKSDAATVKTARDEAYEWAGDIGGPLKIGGGGQNVFEFHNEFILEAVELEELEHEFLFELKLKGSPKQESWRLLPGSEKSEEDGYLTCKMQYSARTPDDLSIPHTGELISAPDGTPMNCVSSKVVDEGNNRKKLYVTLKSINRQNHDDNSSDMADKNIHLLKKEDFSIDNTPYKRLTLYWTKDEYDTEITKVKCWDFGSASNWFPADYAIEKIETVPDGNWGYYAEITARKIITTLHDINKKESADDTSISAVYFVHQRDLNDFTDLIGTLPVFADADHIITSTESSLLNPLQNKITVKAEKLKSFLRLGETASSKDIYGITVKKANFFVKSDDAAAFRDEIINGTPAPWAGDNFYIQSCSEKENQFGTVFEIEAKEIYTRILRTKEQEKFSGFTNSGTPVREIINETIWQTHANDIGNFKEMSGRAADWCDGDNIITEVNPEKISPAEYQIKILAQHRSNPELHTIYNSENFDHLASRTDLDCRLVDFRLSPKDCGYFMHGDGIFDAIPGWRAEEHCPLDLKSRPSVRLINSIHKILRISETVYRKGSLKRNMDDMIEWSQQRIFNGQVGHYRGSYLKYDLRAKEIYDSHGVQWTKITRIYDLAPHGTTWNTHFYRLIGL